MISILSLTATILVHDVGTAVNHNIIINCESWWTEVIVNYIIINYNNNKKNDVGIPVDHVPINYNWAHL